MRAVAGHPIALWVGFVYVHLGLGLLGLYAPGNPLGDVTGVYRFWILDYAFAGHGWVGIDTVWVYPILGIVPMIASAALGPDLYVSTWLLLVMVVNAIAFAVLTAHGRRHGARLVGWWWLAFLVALGPVAVGRIDAFAVAIAMIGMLALLTRPALATALLTVAAWIKVWPAVLVAAAFVAVRERARVALAGAAVSLAVLLTALALGSGANVFSFITQQTGRGLQIEAVAATPWMWDATLGDGHGAVYYDQGILTYQVRGTGVAAVADATTPLLVVVALALLALGALAVRRGHAATAILPPLALALTLAMIIFNKVGSPQFATWIAVPVVFGLVASSAGWTPSFRVPAVAALVAAALTQVVYPTFYSALLGVPEVWLVAVLTARNLLYIVLLGWAVLGLVDLVRRRAEPTAVPHVVTAPLLERQS